MSCDGLLAAGAFSRWVGLYDSYGRGGTTGIFEIKASDTEAEDGDQGSGITQVLWSSCGRYLCIVERDSDGIGVWDVRGTGRRLAWLRGRTARTNQRLHVDILGPELWAGGTDGKVRVWENLGMVEGDVDPAWHFRAHDGKPLGFRPIVGLLSPRKLTSLGLDAVSSAVLHPSGTVLATSSGQRHPSIPLPGPSTTRNFTQDEIEPETGSGNSGNEEPSSPLSRSPLSTSSVSSSGSSCAEGGKGRDNSLRVWAL